MSLLVFSACSLGVHSGRTVYPIISTERVVSLLPTANPASRIFFFFLFLDRRPLSESDEGMCSCVHACVCAYTYVCACVCVHACFCACVPVSCVRACVRVGFVLCGLCGRCARSLAPSTLRCTATSTAGTGANTPTRWCSFLFFFPFLD